MPTSGAASRRCTAPTGAAGALTGDTLIVAAFEVLARAAATDPERAVTLIRILGESTGMPGGICAGQGWESENKIDLSAYHRAKTGALFTAATRMGAAAAGEEPDAWTELGARIGEAFQVADDLRDALYDEKTLGKPAHQDEINGRPNAVAQLGVKGAIRRLEDILSGAIASIPSCPGEAALCDMVRKTAERLTPWFRPSRRPDPLAVSDHPHAPAQPVGQDSMPGAPRYWGRGRSSGRRRVRPSPRAWHARTARRCSTLSPVSSIRRCCAPSSISTSPHGWPTGPNAPRNWRWRRAFRRSGCACFCQAAASLNLMQRRRDGRYALGRLGAALPGIPGLSQMITHHDVLYRDLEDASDFFADGSATELAGFWPYVFGATGDVSPETAETYSELMAQSQTLVAEEALRVVDLRGVTTLLDMGGGTGAFLTAAGLMHPDLHLHLFDLPVVADGAAARFQRNGLTAAARSPAGISAPTRSRPAPTRSASCAFSTTIPTTPCACFWPRRMPRCRWRTPDRGGTDVGWRAAHAQHRRLFRGLLHGHAHRPCPKRRGYRQPPDGGRFFRRLTGQNSAAVHHRRRHREEVLKNDIRDVHSC
jgi:hypothetical protein